MPSRPNPLLLVLMLIYSSELFSQEIADTVKPVLVLPEFTINSSRAAENSPFTFTELEESQIKKENYAQDMPYLLRNQPSVQVTSDAGNGIGYTGIRIRGTDPSRIQVTLDGVPVNDAESQLVYWVNLPDMATRLTNIQIQRGAGLSQSGNGAFGAAIHLTTKDLCDSLWLENNFSLGSFGTLRNTLSGGSGTFAGHWRVEAGISTTKSEGYVDRAASNLNSHFLSLGYYSPKHNLRFSYYYGKEKTYQSWNGVPESRINDDIEGMIDFSIRNYFDQQQTENLLQSGRTYNFYTYENQTDNYRQIHNQFHHTWMLNDRVYIHSTLNGTFGKGYFEEYRKQDYLSSYSLDFGLIGGDTVYQADLVRQKWLDNSYLGVQSFLHVNKGDDQWLAGASYYVYEGLHYNEISEAEFLQTDQLPYQYFKDKGLKKDLSVIGRYEHDFNKNLHLLLDLQVRSIEYQFTAPDPTGNPAEQNENELFANARAGLHYKFNENRSAYLSFAHAGKEPGREEYILTSPQTRPKPEYLNNLELGFQQQSGAFSWTATYYLMLYKDQLVLTGKLNDVGNYNRQNVDRSYRTGIELSAAVPLNRSWSFSGNLTISQNRIEEYTDYITEYDAVFTIVGEKEIHYESSPIAFSPSWQAAFSPAFRTQKGLLLQLPCRAVGRQFLDNTGEKSQSIDPYAILDFQADYTFRFKKTVPVTFSVYLNNLLSSEYESNGYSYRYIYDNSQVTENFYYPQAPLNVIGKVSIRL